MNYNLVKKEIHFLIKEPIAYLGILLMICIVVINMKPFWNLFNNTRELDMPVEYSFDGDIESGYIPTPIEEQYDISLQKLKNFFIYDMELGEEDAEAEIKKMREMKVDDIEKYMEQKYDIKGIQNMFEENRYKHASYEEMQKYLQTSFSNKTYTESFAYKYSDFLSIGSILFTIIIVALVLARDMKKDIYSLLHTKPMRGYTYILSKLFAGISFVFVNIIIITVVMDYIAVSTGAKYGFNGNAVDMWKSVLVLNLPNVILTGCLIMFITILFRTILPSIPALLLYFIYSNMGTTNAGNEYNYQLKPLSLIIRFPGEFAKLSIPDGALRNQVFIFLLIIIVTYGSIKIWNRKRNV
jgi:ABC-2 type transport system permease protein